MPELLFLAHRIPYPPDKGDKIRSWNFLRHLAGRYRIHLGCFVDDPHDWQFESVLRELCAECCILGLDSGRARFRSLRGLATGLPLTLPYYFDRRMARWTGEILARPDVTRVFVYCSAMAQYVLAPSPRPLRRIADFVDVDSAKWTAYAQRFSMLKARLFAREGVRLAQVERAIAAAFDRTLFSTAAEAALFRSAAPALDAKIAAVANGIDSDFFSPDRIYANPYPSGRIPLVFTGAMDYWPNIDAVIHFAREIFPALRRHLPQASFIIVGANPSPDVMALAAAEDIVVTGRVPDVRPFTAHARAVLAPLRIGRGVQNKVLEGMAMGKAVVASPEALEGIAARAGSEVLVAADPDAFIAAICRAVDPEAGGEIGRRARRRVVADYGWARSLGQLDAIIDG